MTISNLPLRLLSQQLQFTNHQPSPTHHQPETFEIFPQPQPVRNLIRKIHKDVQKLRRRSSTLKIQPNAPFFQRKLCGETDLHGKKGWVFLGWSNQNHSSTKVIKVFWDKNPKLSYRFLLCDPPSMGKYWNERHSHQQIYGNLTIVPIKKRGHRPHQS